ncbi:DNA glycosylase, partial [Zopfochytrium polystomum]
FESLASGIIYQQVTWRAAKKIQERFISAFSHSGFPTPQDVLKADHTQLREVGLSRRKVEYLKSLAQAFLSNDDGSPPLLSDNELKIMPNEEATRKLCQVKGIGPWTAHMYLMFALKRVDILPTGDLVLRKGMTAHFTGVPIHEIDAKTLAGLGQADEITQHDRLVEWAAVWEPFRSYGVWYCWRLAEGLIQPKNNEE